MTGDANMGDPALPHHCPAASLVITLTGSATPLFRDVRHATTWGQRLRGLLGQPPLGIEAGLLISPCTSVHTFGMRYSLDLVFIDKRGAVVKCVEALKPNRVAGAYRARHALELAPGSIAAKRIQIGDVLRWRPAQAGVS